MGPEVAKMVRETWTEDVVTDELRFKNALVKLSNAVIGCRRRNDTAGANLWLECLIEARSYTLEASFSTIYAHWLGLVSHVMCDWLVCQHQYEEAIEMATHAWETLDAKDARLEALGLPASPSSGSRWRLLGVLADIKWRMPSEQYRDVVFTPVQHVQAWLRYSQILQADLLSSAPQSDSPLLERQEHLRDDQRRTESLLWAGLWTACCAYRYCKVELVRLVREFNILHRRHYRCAGLALAERHWLDDAPLAPESPMYWHFEIAKQWINEQKAGSSASSQRRPGFSVHELDEAYSQLLMSVDHWTQGRPDKVYSEGLELDFQWMKSELMQCKVATVESGSAGNQLLREETTSLPMA